MTTTPAISDLDRQIVALVAAGYTNLRIARQVELTEDGVKTRPRRLNARLGTRDRAHLVDWFHRHNLPGKDRP